MGRRKIKIAFLKDKSIRQVTFSKRRQGIFKKANELAILCGAGVAVVTFSPGGRAFSFGNPGVNAVIDSYLYQSHGDDGFSLQEQKQLAHLEKQLKVEKEKGKKVDKLLNENKVTELMLSIDELNWDDLQKLKISLEELSHYVNSCLEDREASTSLLLLAEKPVNAADLQVAKIA
ncbi:hypothetical protein L6164_031823 [Bauhinia variegata]|uniref:Uncharacterized protein n=1 Tax=Bauhinia variegata TaxID=167791 RepID=A0ACB9KLX6_BAUVA|nr:hypothetical protein L6164_031823 [Bauhinia variegata]